MIETLARLGYASKALIYALVGVLAAAAAMEQGGRITDRSGVLRVLLRQPFGNAILLVLAVGLCGYAAWRVLDAIFDPDRHGTRFGGLVVRIGNVIRAGIYGMLGVEAFRLARGLRGSGGGEPDMWAARVMQLPFGDWIIGLVGVVVVLYGISEIVTAIREKVGNLIDASALPRAWRSPLLKIARFGVAARATIIVAVGVFLVRAALRHDPREAAGLRDSMIGLVGVFESRLVLGAIAAGLIAYGVDQALHAKCRRIRSPI